MNNEEIDRRGSWTLSSSATPSIETFGNPFIAIECLTSSSLAVKIKGEFGSGTSRMLRYYLLSSTSTEASVDPDTASGTLAAQDIILVPTCGAKTIEVVRTAGSGTVGTTSYATDALTPFLLQKLIDGGLTATITGVATEAKQDTQITSLSVMDDWDESDRAKVNPIVGQAGVAAGAGSVSTTVQRTTLASDDPAVAHLANIVLGPGMREVDVTFTVTNADAMDANDVCAGNNIIATCVSANDANGWLVGFQLHDADDNTAAGYNVFFNASATALGTIDAAISCTDAVAATTLGVVAIAAGDWFDMINGKVVVKGLNDTNMPVFVTPIAGTDDIYVTIQCLGTPTFTTSSLTGKFFFKDAR